MAGLKWALSYKFDDEANSYVLSTSDEETDEEEGQSGEQTLLPKIGPFDDDDLDDLDDSDSE